MKFSKFVIPCLLIFSMLIPIIGTARAAEPNYVGFSEGQEVIWECVLDKDPVEDYFEDAGLSEAAAKIAADNLFDSYELDDDWVGIRFYIEEIKEEDDDDFDATYVDDEDDVKYVKYLYNWYSTEDLSDNNAWEKEETLESAKLWEAEELVYADHLIAAYYANGIGLFAFVVPKGLDWGKVISEADDYLDDHDTMDDKYDIATAKQTNFFFFEDEVGVRTNREHSGDVEDFDSFSKYTSDGLLYHYQWTYDGDIIAEFKLYGIFGAYFQENWWWMALAAIGVVIVIIVVVILIKRRK